MISSPAPHSKQICIVMLGPPMSGKGTLARQLATSLSMEHIDLGSIIRQSKHPEVEKIINAGKLLDDDLVIEIASSKIMQTKGMILDGFPRSAQQARYLCSQAKTLDLLAIELQLSIDVALSRLSARVMCSVCFRTHNNTDKKCECGAQSWVRRKDDDPNVLRHRYDEYEKYSYDVLDVCKGSMPIVSLNGALPQKVVCNSVMQSIKTRYEL